MDDDLKFVLIICLIILAGGLVDDWREASKKPQPCPVETVEQK